MIGSVPPGLPTVKPPPFGYTTESNGTLQTVSTIEMISNLGSGIIVVPLIGLLENIAICKAFGES